MAVQGLDSIASSCPTRCDLYEGGKFPCKLCFQQAVVYVQAVEEKLQAVEEKVRFLQAYEPSPLDENFRGDISFVGCDKELVYAHRFLMASKSMVFRRMFDIDMKEKESGTVRVDDAVAPVLRSMVNYCYTADIQFTEEAPVEELSHKYDIKELKAVCESELSRGIKKENFCDILKLAYKYDAEELKRVAAKFFRENFNDVYYSVVERLC